MCWFSANYYELYKKYILPQKNASFELNMTLISVIESFRLTHLGVLVLAHLLHLGLALQALLQARLLVLQDL